MTLISNAVSLDRALPLSAAVGRELAVSAPQPRLLIVDDLVDNRAILARRFQRRGFEVTEADGGLRALELIAQQPFDAVLLDVMMPDLDGLQVVRRIREQHCPAALPVIMVTARAQNEDVIRALNLGANDYVTKPVDFDVAFARVNAQIGRKRMEDALRESEARYRLLADHATDMIVRADLSGKRNYVSPASKDLLGYNPDELVGTRPQNFVHPDEAARLTEVFSKLREGQTERATGTYRLRHRNGSWVWIEDNLHLVRDKHGMPLEVISASRDVTERQRQSDELRLAKEAAEQASQAKTEFLAVMSHETRTPLNGILGYADLLLNSQGLDQEQHRHAERIRTAGSALLMILNDILEFSQLEGGKTELQQQPFSPAVLLDSAVSIVKASADQKQLALEVDVASPLPELLVGDQDRLRQILLNLLNNAIKFTPQGRVVLAVQPRAISDTRCILRFAISDTGIGIANEKQGRLFQMFSQVDGSVRRRFGGTGLGLAISQHLAQLMGGEIRVNSELGRGATFSFEIPLEVASDTDRGSIAEQKHAPSRSARILLVEDNDINQEIARAMLEAEGHQVDVAADGSIAVMRIQASRYDLVLMDVQMPVMDGLTATRCIRALDPPIRDLPIIALTANILPQQIHAFREAGMSDYIGKPFRREELYTIVDRWSGAAREGAPPLDDLGNSPCPLQPSDTDRYQIGQAHVA
jgi:PAS domain S-box-containing protein